MRLELVGWEKFYALHNNGTGSRVLVSAQQARPNGQWKTHFESRFIHAQSWGLAEMPYTGSRAQNSELRIWKKYSNVYHWRLFIEFSSELIEVLWMKYPRKMFCKID